jgi:hypothetical protein
VASGKRLVAGGRQSLDQQHTQGTDAMDGTDDGSKVVDWSQQGAKEVDWRRQGSRDPFSDQAIGALKGSQTEKEHLLQKVFFSSLNRDDRMIPDPRFSAEVSQVLTPLAGDVAGSADDLFHVSTPLFGDADRRRSQPQADTTDRSASLNGTRGAAIQDEAGPLCPTEARPWGVSCPVCQRFGPCPTISAWRRDGMKVPQAKRHKGLETRVGIQEDLNGTTDLEAPCKPSISSQSSNTSSGSQSVGIQLFDNQSATFEPSNSHTNVGEFDSETRDPSVPDGYIFVGALYEQALFDQFLRTEHRVGLWDFIRSFGMDATNAAYGEFEHSCGHLLNTGGQQKQSTREPPCNSSSVVTSSGNHQARRRLSGKQGAPAGTRSESSGSVTNPGSDTIQPGSETIQLRSETIQPEDADGHVLMVYKGWNLIWCSVCGRYQTDKRTCRLRDRCPKQPVNRSHYRLKRLQGGRHPTTGEPLGETAQRLTLAGGSAEDAISACAKGGAEMAKSLTPGKAQSGGTERASTAG